MPETALMVDANMEPTGWALVERLQSESFRIQLAQACLMGAVEGALEMRGTLSDAGLLDLIQTATERAQTTINEIKAERI